MSEHLTPIQIGERWHKHPQEVCELMAMHSAKPFQVDVGNGFEYAAFKMADVSRVMREINSRQLEFAI